MLKYYPGKKWSVSIAKKNILRAAYACIIVCCSFVKALLHKMKTLGASADFSHAVMTYGVIIPIGEKMYVPYFAGINDIAYIRVSPAPMMFIRYVLSFEFKSAYSKTCNVYLNAHRLWFGNHGQPARRGIHVWAPIRQAIVLNWHI